VELHNQIVASEGGDPSAVLEQLSHSRYSTFALSGEMVERSAILDQPIVRIIAQRKEQ